MLDYIDVVHFLRTIAAPTEENESLIDDFLSSLEIDGPSPAASVFPLELVHGL
ncbi:hypothetical protein D3C74_159870 [compost metagenome]